MMDEAASSAAVADGVTGRRESDVAAASSMRRRAAPGVPRVVAMAFSALYRAFRACMYACCDS